MSIFLFVFCLEMLGNYFKRWVICEICFGIWKYLCKDVGFLGFWLVWSMLDYGKVSYEMY